MFVGGAAWETLADFPKDPVRPIVDHAPTRPDPRRPGGGVVCRCRLRRAQVFWRVNNGGPFSGYGYYQLIDNRSTARPKSRQTPLQNDNEQLTKFWMLFGYMSEEVFFLVFFFGSAGLVCLWR